MSRILQLFKPAPHIEPIQDEAEVKKVYRHWRVRMMYSTMIGYAAFYFVRKNFSMAMPAFLQDLGYTKTDLGLILSLFSIIYGLGKFLNGVLADRSNPRYFMPLGLCCAAIVNILFGLSSGIVAFGLFWLLNAWFQSMGWPPCARMLTHWYSPTELGTKWGIWNASHQLGGAGILILSGYLISTYGWRYAFFVPAIIAVVIAFFLVNRLRDTPQSLGLPPVDQYREGTYVDADHEDTAESFKEIFFKYIITNRLLWLVCFANIFVYIVRIGALDWAPTFLVEAKNTSIMNAGFITAASEIVGILGAITAGWFSDRIFKGKRGPVNVLCMFLVILAMVGLWKTPPGHNILIGFYLVAVKFLIYGPQMLVAVAAADFATKKAASTATGLTGMFGYAGSALCGAGTGIIVDRWGWDGGFIFFIAAASIGMCLFFFTWSHRSKVLEDIHSRKK